MAQLNKTRKARRCWDDDGRHAFLNYVASLYHPTLIGYARGLCSSSNQVYPREDDLMQLFYERVYMKFTLTYQKYEELGVKYFRGMLRLQYLQELRKYKRKYLTEELVLSGSTEPLVEELSEEDQVYVEQIMEVFRSQVSADHYCVYELYLQGYAYKEIASILELKVNTIGSIISRSKKKLSIIMNE
ncbi:MAG: sigma-70 family RNA polymerase sigma factor [Bacteroidota bacterium]